MKKFAVYTASIGGYDEIHQPLAVDDRFDYIFFSNNVNRPNENHKKYMTNYDIHNSEQKSRLVTGAAKENKP